MHKIKDVTNILQQLAGFYYQKNTELVYEGCNHRYAKLVGLSSEKNIDGKSNDILGLTKDLIEQFCKNEVKTLLTEQPVSDVYQFCISPHNQILSIYFECTPLYNEKSKLIGLLALGFDISEKQMKKEAIESERDLIEDVLYQLPGLIYWKNTHSQYMGFNQNVVRLSGLSRGELKGKSDADLNWGQQEADSFKKDDQEVIEKGIVKITEHQIPVKRPDGNWMFVRTEKSRLLDRDGNIKGILGVAMDITEEKLLTDQLKREKERVENANFAKIEFLHNMEHQLRTPFSGIYTLVELLSKTEKNLEKKIMMEETFRSAKELLDVIDEIITFSRQISEGPTIIRRKFDLPQLIENTVVMQKAVAMTKGLNITTDYPKSLPLIFIGDPMRIKRILMNLLSNAIKFTETGEINVKVRLGKKINKQKYILQLIVNDTGIGIDKKLQTSIYEPFYRISPANHNIYQGAGLGLNIVKQLIEDLGGEIDLISEPRKGSTFICTIPFERPLIDKVISDSLDT